MIKISILYPNTPNSRFDMVYYLEQHMPLSISLLSAHPDFQSVSVEQGLSGVMPGSPPTYSVMCHFLFTSIESFIAAFMPHAAQLQADIANYTDVEPIIQFNQVLVSQ
jgi:uncharacterized protein (TIGR02118 family)